MFYTLASFRVCYATVVSASLSQRLRLCFALMGTARSATLKERQCLTSLQGVSCLLDNMASEEHQLVLVSKRLSSLLLTGFLFSYRNTEDTPFMLRCGYHRLDTSSYNWPKRSGNGAEERGRLQLNV
jgi:hypothetical protein